MQLGKMQGGSGIFLFPFRAFELQEVYFCNNSIGTHSSWFTFRLGEKLLNGLLIIFYASPKIQFIRPETYIFLNWNKWSL